MSAAATPARYSSAAIILHWTLAALLLFQLGLGWRLEALAGLPQFAAYQLHKTIGIAILLLSLARLAIRLMVPRPAPARMSRPAALLSGAVHAGLYLVMIGGPITGWILVSTAPVKVQTMFLGMLPWPHLPLGAGWHDPAEALHGLIGWLFAGLCALHVAGALRHHLMHDDILARMLPRAVAGRARLNRAALAMLAGAALIFALAWVLPFDRAAAPAPARAGANAGEADAPAAAAPVMNRAAPDAAMPEATNAAEAADNAAGAQAEAAARAVPWQVQPGGRLGFRADYGGSPVEGAFARWEADILFSPDDLPGSRISVTIDLASVDTADAERDDTLRSDGFFDIAAHPRATFRARRISHRGGNAYRAAGTLSLHGQQRPVTLDFTLDISGDTARARGSAALSRTAFGVGTGEWADTGTIKDAVSISFDFGARRQ